MHPRPLIRILLSALLLVLLCAGAGCQKKTPASGGAAAPAGSSGVPQIQSGEAGDVAPLEEGGMGRVASEYMPAKGAPRQLILFYTGDTLSIPDANRSYTPAEGGLPALANELLTYQRRVVDYNRERVESEGGDGATIKSNYEDGLLGEHPYLLLDYGGWERLNDPAGEIYVKLYADYFDYFKYFAVGSKLYAEVDDEKWGLYREAAPRLQLLVSAGEIRAAALPSVKVRTRMAHGELWGVAAIPLPDIRGLSKDAAFALIEKKFKEYVDAAASELAASGCKYSVLLAPGWGAAQYESIAEDSRFDVVIGVGQRLAAAEGYGDLTAGPLFLPELEPRGRQLGICHLYWPVGKPEPDMYYLTLRKVIDDPQQRWPFRQQVSQALSDHIYRMSELADAGKILGE